MRSAFCISYQAALGKLLMPYQVLSRAVRLPLTAEYSLSHLTWRDQVSGTWTTLNHTYLQDRVAERKIGNPRAKYVHRNSGELETQ